MIRVFVYGTLMVGQVNHRVVEPYLLFVQPGCLRGRLYDAGDYPGLVLDVEGPLIHGEWLTVTSDGLKAMDLLEEYNGPGGPNDYDRVWVKDEEQDDLEGWVYVWSDSRGLPRIKEREQ